MLFLKRQDLPKQGNLGSWKIQMFYDVTEFFCCDFVTQPVGNFTLAGRNILPPESDEQILKTC
jgi:hypothetical protein